MLRYAFDLYPRLDPRDGAVIRRLEYLQQASFKDEENGTGSGQFVINGGSPDADDIDPLGLDYIRVVEIDDLDAERVVGGFFLDSGDYEALTRRETRKLKLGGAGTLSYLQRAVMWSRSYLSIGGIHGSDPVGETWNLSAQTVILAAGNHLGAMLWRVIYEAQHFQSGSYTHVHYDGTLHTGTHADDRTESAIPDLVMTFDGFEDSDGNPWTLTAGDFKAQVGESVLDVVRRLMEMGLRVEMDPDTFELHAWEAPHRTDRTSGSWAAGKVRFQAPIGQDVATGNILSDTNRKVRAYIQRSVVLAGAQNSYAISQGSTEPPWEGGYRLDTDETTTPAAVASRQRLARSDAVDNVKLVFKLGDDELDGIYRPWDHVSPGDLVTLHTGTETWEYDETTFPVAGLTVELKEGGDWRGIVELGSSFTSLLEPAFHVSGAPGHTHPPNPALCLIPTPGTESITRLYFSNASADPDPATDAAWESGGSTTPGAKQLKTTADGTFTGAHSLTSSAGGVAGGRDVFYLQGVYGPLSSAEAAIIAAGGSVITGQLRCRARFGIGIDEADQDMISQISVRVTQGNSTTIRGTAKALHTAASSSGASKWPAASTKANKTFPPTGQSATLAAVAGCVAGDYLVVEVGSRNFTIDSETSGGAIALTNDAVSDLPEDNSTTTALNSWLQWSVSGVGATTGDLPLDTVHQDEESVGTSVRAARCDHQHAHGLLSADGLDYHDFNELTLSDDTPLEESGSGAAGTASEASRADHVHPAGSGALDDLSDVDTTGVSDGDVLTYDSGSGDWVAEAPSGGSGSGVVPWAIYPEYGASEVATGGVGANNRTIYVPVTIPADCTITGVRIRVSTGGGSNQISLALMDDAGNRVATTGAITTPANGVSSTAFTASASVTAGRYWLAISASSSGTGFSLAASATNNTPAYTRFENAHPVPSSMTSAGETSVKPILVGIISGGAP